MSTLVERIKQWVGGPNRAAVQRLSADVAALREQLSNTQQQLRDLQTSHEQARGDQVEQFDKIREVLTEVTDDLTARMAALRNGLGADVTR